MDYLKNRIQTITIEANEVKVEMPYENICIRNNGENTIYASVNPDVIPYTDGVMEIKSGNSKVLRDCYDVHEGEAVCYLYCEDIGIVEVESANDLAFVSQSSGGGGGGVTPTTDTYTKEQINAKLLTKVDKRTGYGLSQNDFTNEYKNKIESFGDGVQLKSMVDTVEDLPSTEEANVGDWYYVGLPEDEYKSIYLYTADDGWTKFGEQSGIDMSNYIETEEVENKFDVVDEQIGNKLDNEDIVAIVDVDEMFSNIFS